MKHSPSQSPARPIILRQLRAGLAPLELVLALPLMLCVMAFMVNFGNAGTWKIRAATSARLAMWRNRPLWGAGSDPKPANWWPPTASMNITGSSRVSQVDGIWNHPDIAQAWIKGPVFTVPNGYLALRDKRVNEMSEGLQSGRADVSMKFPFLPSQGNMSLQADHHLTDSLWQFHSMGYSRNDRRRAKDWWNLEDSPDWSPQKNLFLEADDAIQNNPLRELMRPLDRDPDLMAGRYSFDFYPRQSVQCVNDPRQVHDNLIMDFGLLDQIRGRDKSIGVNRSMATSYVQMYSDELARLLALPVPPLVRIAQLRRWIDELNDFMATLP